MTYQCITCGKTIPGPRTDDTVCVWCAIECVEPFEPTESFANIFGPVLGEEVTKSIWRWAGVAVHSHDEKDEFVADAAESGWTGSPPGEEEVVARAASEAFDSHAAARATTLQ
jgi:hypothetical protein